MKTLSFSRRKLRVECNFSEGWLTVLKDDEDDEGRYHPVVLYDLDVSHHPYALLLFALVTTALIL